MVHGRPGVEPQIEKREQFAQLIAQGVSNRQACLAVGISRKTGTRWRLGRTITTRDGRRRHYALVIGTRPREISPRYLSEDERVRIGDLRRAGYTIRAIASELGRSASTISREVRRNGDERSGQYRPSPRIGWPWSVALGRAAEDWSTMECCGSSWPTG